MATHSSILVWRIPRTEEPGGLPFMGLHRVGHDWSDLAAAAEWVTELREIFYLLDYWFIIKDYNSGVTRWKRCTRQVVGKEVRNFQALWMYHSTQISRCSPTQKFSQPHPFRVLWHRHDWLSNWPLAIISISSTAPLSQGQGFGSASSNLQSHGWLLRQLVPILSCGPKVTSLTQTQVWLKGVYYE